MDLDEAARRLYGGAPESPAPAPAVEPPKTEQQLAEAIYKEPDAPTPRELPEAIRELRATPERRLFDSAKGQTALPPGALDVADYQVDHEETIRVAADLGATGADLQELRTIIGQHRDLDDATFQTWTTESTAMFGEGREFSQRDLDDARRLVARDPAVSAWLDATGMGSNPQVVRRFVELARSARGRQEL